MYDLWEVRWAWPSLMQPVSIFITPTSCAYDILALPQHAKSPLSLLLLLALILSLSLSLCFWSLSLAHLLYVLMLLCGRPPSPSISELKGQITLTPSVISVCPSISWSAGWRSEQICQGQC